MDWIGKTLGRYRILAKLGEGGMGEVYRARDEELHREVALKILPTRVASDAEARARFVREARAVANLSHPNILSIYDFAGGDEVVYAVTELLEGETLQEAIWREGTLPWRRVASIGKAIAEGLAGAHEKGIVHRDLKPANVFVTRAGHVKILDFGLAKRTRPALDIDGSDPANTPTFRMGDSGAPPADPTLRTSPGVILGTLGYMSPEQVRGHEADARSDLFALGCVLHEMMAGRRPFEQETPIDTLTAILKDEPLPIPPGAGPYPDGLRAIALRCLAKKADDRPVSAQEVALFLGRLLDEEPVSAVLPAPATAAPPSAAAPALPSAPGAVVLPSSVDVAETVAPKRRRWLVPAVALLLLLALGLVARGWRARRGSPAAARRAAAATAVPSELPPRVVALLQLTEGPQLEGNPSLSKDGKTVVYQGGEYSQSDIYRLRVGGTNPMNLTADFPGDDVQPALSPDEQWIVFRSERDGGGLFVMGATGESVRRLTKSGFDPAWSPDGTKVVFATDSSFVPASRGRKSELWVVDAAGGEPVKLFDGDAADPAWSPDGTRIAFCGVAPGTSRLDVFTIPAAGGPATAVTSDDAVDWTPAWTPDGRHLVFASSRGGDLSLWRIAVTADGRPAAPPESVTASAGATQSQPSLSGDGRLVAHTRAVHGASLWELDFDPAAAKPIGEPRPLTETPGRWMTPSRSADGTLVTFSSNRPREDIFVMKVGGTDRRQLTDDAAFDRWPRFSPDGRRILFYSNRSGKSAPWLVAPDGGDLQPLGGTPLPGTSSLWSPDGESIAYLDTDAKRVAIRTVDDATSAPRLLPALADGRLFLPTSWSPDGRFLAGHMIAVGSAADGVQDGLAVFELKDERWSFPIDEGLHPRWLPDSRRLLFWRRGNLEVVDRSGGPSRVAVSLASPTVHPGFDISPDGKLLTLGRHAFESDIWTAELAGPDPATAAPPPR